MIMCYECGNEAEYEVQTVGEEKSYHYCPEHLLYSFSMGWRVAGEDKWTVSLLDQAK